MKKKFLSALLALTLLVSMQPVQAFAEQMILTDPAVKDIFLNVDSDAGYSTTDLAAAVESEIANLGGTTPPEYRINTNNTQIDTTNLSNWYVYDHYDTAYWAARAATLSLLVR